MTVETNTAPDAYTTPGELMTRHARTFVPCALCWDRFEHQRQHAGLGNFTAVFCEHNGVRVGWNGVGVTLDLCATRSEHERINAGYQQFLRRSDS